MEVQAHTTPEARNDLRVYLRNRRLMGSHHQAITYQTRYFTTRFSRRVTLSRVMSS